MQSSTNHNMENLASIYIQPDISFYSDVEDVFSKEAEYERYIFPEEKKPDFWDILRTRKTILVAEPGYGKTRLLQELVKNAKEKNRKAIYADLKKTTKKGIEICLQQLAAQTTAIKTEDFDLINTSDVIVCLDALDEVKQDEYSDTIEQISAFVEKFDNISVIVSSRLHHLAKHKELFNNLGFRYAIIHRFSENQARLFLRNCHFSNEDIDNICNSLRFQGRDLVILTPRYLELLARYMKGKDISTAESITITDLFEYFIYRKLESEDKKYNRQKRDIIKRILEKLALIMEIYQTNILSKDDLMTFFDDVKSDLKQVFLHQVPLEAFFDNSLLKDNIESIEFENTEFQEYLAAKEITRLGNPVQTCFELAVDPEIREIYPSWFNTLRFLVNLDISVLKPLLDFGERKGNQIGTTPIQDEEYHRLLTNVSTERLSLGERKSIFEQIFKYYQSVLHWLPDDIAKNLSHYFDRSQIDLLNHYADGRQYRNSETRRWVCQSNVAQVVGHLFDRDVFNPKEKNYWKKKLINFANDGNENGVLQRTALFALGKTGDVNVIRKVEDAWKSNNELIKRAFLDMCRKLDPNHELALGYFVEGIKQEVLFTRHALHEIDNPNSIKKLLDFFINDREFLRKYVDKERIYEGRDNQLIRNIELAWDEETQSKLETLVHQSIVLLDRYFLRRSEFVIEIVKLLKNKRPKYLFDLIDGIANSDDLKACLYSMPRIFAAIIDKDQVEKFIEALSRFEGGRRIALLTIQNVKFSDRQNSNEIFEKGRKFLPDEFKQAEKEWEKINQEPAESQWIYFEFKNKLEPKKGHYNLGVFRFYLENKSEVESQLTQTDKDRILKLVEDILPNDPAEYDLKITQEGEGIRSYTISRNMSVFGDCIRVAHEFGMNVSNYRSQIINYIPFAYYEHLEAIFSFCGDIKENELETVLSVYNKKKSDLWKFAPGNLIRVAERYMITGAVPILRSFVEESTFSQLDRERALEASEILRPDLEYLEKIFEEYLKKNGERFLSEKANELLIEKHNKEEAIDWRFEQEFTK